MESTINLIIAEDHPTFSFGIEQNLSNFENISIIGKASNGKQLMQMLNSLTPDLILLDIMMPYMTGIEAAKQIKRKAPFIKIIFITMYEDSHIIEQCKEFGDGYISKSTTVDELIKAINIVVCEKGKYFLKSTVKNQIDIYDDYLVKKYKLTKREIELIQLLKSGKTTKEIAQNLFLSTFTIETHRKNIFRKLQVKNIAEMISFAINNSII